MTSHSENEAFKKKTKKQNTSLSQCTVHGNISRTRNHFTQRKKTEATKSRQNRGYLLAKYHFLAFIYRKRPRKLNSL